jgi:HEAT repeat protein
MSTLELLDKKLQSSDAEERREAAVDLSRAGRGSIPLLLRALGDRDWRVRKTAVEGLVGFGGDEVMRGLVRCLSAEDNAGARNSAIEALVQLGTASVPVLMPLLETRDRDVRKFILDILGDIRDTRAVPGIIGRLKDGDENVRVAAAEALGKLGDRSAVDALIACLGASDQSWLDYAAAEALGEIGDERALGPLLAALERSSLREPVIESLGKIGNANVLQPLIAGLADPLRIVREVSTEALTSIFRKSSGDDRRRIVDGVRSGADGQVVSLLEGFLDTSGGALQRAAVAVLGWMGRRDSVPKLLSLLREEDMEEPVVDALRSIGRDAVPSLLERLADESVLVRRVAALVLGEFGRAEAEDALRDLLQDENGHVRGTAADSLGRIRSAKAVPQLVRLLEDEYENVQESAIRALAAVGDDSVLDGLIGDFSSHAAAMRRNIVRLLGLLGTGKAVNALAYALKDEEPLVRKAVVIALDGIPDDRTVRPLLLAVTDDDPEVRMLAAEAVAKSAAPEASEALIPLLDDEDLWVRAAAARGLGKLGARRFGAILAGHLGAAQDIFLLALIDVAGAAALPEALEPLLALADHNDPEVRKSVIAALAFYAWTRVRPTVLARLFDEHWSVRKSAAEVLGRNRDAATDQILLRMAEEDADASVRQAARDALGS